MELQYQVEQLQDVAIVRCSGRLVRGAVLDGFRQRLEQLQCARMLVLDLSEIEQLDAGGLSALIDARRWTKQRAVQLKLVNPAPFVRKVLEATRLIGLFEISSLEEALCVLRAPACSSHYAVA